MTNSPLLMFVANFFTILIAVFCLFVCFSQLLGSFCFTVFVVYLFFIELYILIFNYYYNPKSDVCVFSLNFIFRETSKKNSSKTAEMTPARSKPRREALSRADQTTHGRYVQAACWVREHAIWDGKRQ